MGGRQFELKTEFLDSANSKNTSWAIDSMLIDEEMLYLEDEEADKMYLELKQRSVFRRNLEEKENRLNIAMQAAADEEDEDELDEARLLCVCKLVLLDSMRASRSFSSSSIQASSSLSKSMRSDVDDGL